MPRTALTPVVLPSEVGVTAGTLLTGAADVANGNSVVLTGNEILIALGGASGGNVSVTSVADAYGRTKDITADALTANQIKVYPRFSVQGWRQSDGTLLVNGTSTVTFIVLRIV